MYTPSIHCHKSIRAGFTTCRPAQVIYGLSIVDRVMAPLLLASGHAEFPVSRFGLNSFTRSKQMSSVSEVMPAFWLYDIWPQFWSYLSHHCCCQFSLRLSSLTRSPALRQRYLASFSVMVHLVRTCFFLPHLLNTVIHKLRFKQARRCRGVCSHSTALQYLYRRTSAVSNRRLRRSSKTR